MFEMVFKMLPNTTGDNIEELNDNGTDKAKKTKKTRYTCEQIPKPVQTYTFTDTSGINMKYEI